MIKLRFALLAAGLSLACASAQGNEPGNASQRGEQDPQAQGTNAAVPPGADADERTTRAGEPGPGVRHGSNEGGSDRETTADQPTATPGTAENLDAQSSPGDPARGNERNERQ